MRGVEREDAIKVWVTRDGTVYLGFQQIRLPDLPAKIQGRLKDREVERKVYVVADMRARWEGVEAVLDEVRSAGIVRVAFLADQGELQGSHTSCFILALSGGAENDLGEIGDLQSKHL